MKNKFLLLSGMATIAVASVALAEDPAPVTAETYSNRATATLNTSILIYSPITMTDGSLSFPIITTTNTNGSAPITVKVNPDGTIDYGESTAQIIEDTEAFVNPIVIIGGGISYYKSAYTAEGADAATLDDQYSNSFSFGSIHTVELTDTIPMYVVNSNQTLSNTKCGEVSDLVPEWHYTSYEGSEAKGALELSIGGTFTLENFELNDSSTYCKGSTTVTYIMDI